MSHGCVSKILARFNETGSIAPRTVGGKKATPEIVEKIKEYKVKYPAMTAKMIVNLLLTDGVCDEKTIPSQNNVREIVHEKVSSVLNPDSPLNEICPKTNSCLVSESDSSEELINKTHSCQQSSGQLDQSISQYNDFSSTRFTQKLQSTQMSSQKMRTVPTYDSYTPATMTTKGQSQPYTPTIG